MSPRDLAYVGHMLDMTRKALDKTAGIARNPYDADENLRLALTHLVQVIGEAARRVSPEFCGEHPEIPWTEIVGMRHKLVHDYLGVDEDIVWQVVTDDLPKLLPTPWRTATGAMGKARGTFPHTRRYARGGAGSRPASPVPGASTMAPKSGSISGDAGGIERTRRRRRKLFVSAIWRQKRASRQIFPNCRYEVATPGASNSLTHSS